LDVLEFLVFLVFSSFISLPLCFLLVSLFLFGPVDILDDIVNLHFVHLHIIASLLFRNLI
jgi:hypothetical protein